MTEPADPASPRALGDQWAARAHDELGAAEGTAFLTRLSLATEDMHEALSTVYGGVADIDTLLERAVRMSLATAAERPAELRLLDRRREIDPDWFLRPRMQGYVCYLDRFCGSLAALPERIDYLAELGTTYLHLMPLLRPRPGENDGG